MSEPTQAPLLARRWPYKVGPYTLFNGWAIVRPDGLHCGIARTKRQAFDAARAMRQVGLGGPGERVRCWPGSREGRSLLGTTLAYPTVWGDGCTPVVRVEKDDGGTDYFALTHVQRGPSEIAGDAS